MKRLASRQPKAGYTYIEYTCIYIYIYICMYIIHMSHTYLHKLDFLLQDSILFGFLIVLHIIFVPRALFIIR